jgi:hypothetical protein
MQDAHLDGIGSLRCEASAQKCGAGCDTGQGSHEMAAVLHDIALFCL